MLSYILVDALTTNITKNITQNSIFFKKLTEVKMENQKIKTLCINSIHDSLILDLLHIGNSKWIKVSNSDSNIAKFAMYRNINGASVKMTFKSKDNALPCNYAHFTSQEIFMLTYIYHEYLENDTSDFVSIDLKHIHKNIRNLGFKKNMEIDVSTNNSYISALKRLQQREIQICNKSEFFTEPFIQKVNDEQYYLGELGKIIKKRKQFTNTVLPPTIYHYDFKQIRKFCIALEIGRCINVLKKRGGYYFEINLVSLLRKIPKFTQQGFYSGVTYYEMLKNFPEKTKYIRLFFNDVISILEDLKKSDSIVNYTVYPYTNNINNITRNNFMKFKFIVYLHKHSIN